MTELQPESQQRQWTGHAQGYATDRMAGFDDGGPSWSPDNNFDDNPENKLSLQAEEFMRQGRFHDAVARYEELQQLTPEDLWAAIGYASALEMAGEVSEAISVMERSGSSHKRNPHLQRFLHMFYERREDYNRAQLCREALHVLESNQEEPPDQLADLYFNQGRYNEASTELARVIDNEDIEDDALKASLHARMGACQRQLGNLEEAREQLMTSLAFAPDNHWTLSELADTERSLGNIDLARRYYLRALENNPDDHWTRGHLAQLEFEDGNHEQAAELYEAVLDAKPRTAWALVELAQVIHASEPVRARELCQQAIEIDPSYPWAYSQLAQIERANGNLASARKYFQQTLSILPSATWVLNELADVCRQLGRTEEAHTHLEHARNNEPFDPSPYGYTADLLRQEGRFDEAIAYLKKAVELDDDYVWAWRELAELHAIRGQHDDAEHAFERASENSADDPVNDGLKAFLLRHRKRFDESLPYLRRAVNGDPSYEWAWRELIELLLQLKRLDEAEQTAKEACSHNTESATLFILHAEVLRRRGEKGQAILVLEHLATFAPRHAHAIALHAELLLDQNQEEALTLARNAVTLDGDNIEFRLLLAQCLLHNQQLAEAKELLGHLLMLDPVPAAASEMAADLALHEERLDDAIAACDKGLNSTPQHPRLILMRTKLALKAQEENPTQRLLIALDEDTPLAWSEAAQYFLEAREEIPFRRACERALQNAKSRNQRLHTQQILAEGELLFGNVGAAAHMSDQILAIEPDHIQSRLIAALLAERRNDMSVAQEHMQHVHNLMDDDQPWEQRRQVDLHLIRLFEANKETDAVSMLWENLHLSYPDEPEITLGYAHWLLKQNDERGLDLLQSILSTENPESDWWQQALYERSVRMYREGDSASARKLLEQSESLLSPVNRRFFALLLLQSAELSTAREQAQKLVDDFDKDQNTASSPTADNRSKEVNTADSSSENNNDISLNDRKLVLLRVLISQKEFAHAQTLAEELPASDDQAIALAEAHAGQGHMDKACETITATRTQHHERLLIGACLLLETSGSEAAHAWLETSRRMP